MPYRRSGETLEVRTAAGAHEIMTTLDGLEVRGPDGSHLIVTRTSAIAGRQYFPIAGRVLVAQNGPLDDVAIWIESAPTMMRRIFSCATPTAAPAMRRALRRHHPDVVAASELGGARHRMLLVELTDRHELYTGRLFREHADLALTLFRDGTMTLRDATQPLQAPADLTLDVQGHDVRFVARNERGVARFAFPWLAASERIELARRLTRALTMQVDVARLGS